MFTSKVRTDDKEEIIERRANGWTRFSRPSRRGGTGKRGRKHGLTVFITCRHCCLNAVI